MKCGATQSLWLASVLGSTLLLIVTPAGAQPAPAYQFTPIVDNSGPFQSFGAAAVSRDGDVAFYAASDTGTRGVYVIRGGLPVPIFERQNSSLSVLHVDINDNGQVALLTLEVGNGSEALYRGTGVGGPTLIADTTGAFRRLETGVSGPRITNAGRVLVPGIRTDGTTGIYDGPDPVANRIAHENGPYFAYELMRPRPDGTVLFGGVRPGGSFAVLAGSDAGASVVFDYGPNYDNAHNYVENSRGQFAFDALMKVRDGREPPGIFTGRDPATDTFALASNPPAFWHIGDPRINDNGLIVFSGTRSFDFTATGIYAGPDPDADRIIQPGDALFGSVVRDAKLGGLDESNRVYFSYRLEDGRAGVASVLVPEPASVGIVAPVALLLCRRTRRRRVGS